MKKHMFLSLLILFSGCSPREGKISTLPGQLLSLSQNEKFALVKTGYRKLAVVNLEQGKIFTTVRKRQSHKLPPRLEYFIYQKTPGTLAVLNMNTGKEILQTEGKSARLSRNKKYLAIQNSGQISVHDLQSAKTILTNTGDFIRFHGQKNIIIKKQDKDLNWIFQLISITNNRVTASTSGVQSLNNAVLRAFITIDKKNTTIWPEEHHVKRVILSGKLFSVNKKLKLAVTTEDDRIHIYNLQNGMKLATFKGNGGHISPDGSQIAIASGDNELELLNIKTKASTTALKGQFIRFSPNGKYLVIKTGYKKHFIAETGGGETRIPVNGRIWDGDESGRLILTGNTYSTTKDVWDINTGKKLYSLNGKTIIRTSLKGTFITSSRNTTSIYNKENGTLRFMARGRFRMIANNDKYLVTGRRRKSYIWDIEKKKKLYESEGTISHYSKDGSRFFLTKNDITGIHSLEKIRQAGTINLIISLVSSILCILLILIIIRKISKHTRMARERAIQKHTALLKKSTLWWDNKIEDTIPCDICTRDITRGEGFILSPEDAFASSGFRNAVIITTCEILKKPLADINRERLLEIVRQDLLETRGGSGLLVCPHCSDNLFNGLIYSGYRIHITQAASSNNQETINE